MTTSSSSSRPTAVGAGLLGAFFLSGAAALIYQVLWTRRLSLTFGVTVYAASTVLAVFMAGLAIGSYIAGRVSDRVERPVRLFALVEVLIAITALITPYALQGVESLYVSIAPSLTDAQILKTLVRGGLAALVLIGPAILMGSTYPLLLRAASRTATGLSTSAALLYGINTAGAIAGTLLGSLWLVPALGMQKSFLAAAAINLAVAGTAWLFGRNLGAGAGEAAESSSASSSSIAAPSAGARRAVLVVMCLRRGVARARDHLVPHSRVLSAADHLRVCEHARGRAARHGARQPDRHAAAQAPHQLGLCPRRPRNGDGADGPHVALRHCAQLRPHGVDVDAHVDEAAVRLRAASARLRGARVAADVAAARRGVPHRRGALVGG
jgi:hypothetical protein